MKQTRFKAEEKPCFSVGQLVQALPDPTCPPPFHQNCLLLLELEPSNWQPTDGIQAWKVLMPNGNIGTVYVDPNIWEIVS